MSNTVLVNDTVKITVKFIDGNQEEVSPSDVIVTIVDSQGEAVTAPTVNEVSPSEYYINFTPTYAEQYTISFIGLIPNAPDIVASQILYVSDPDEEYKPTVTLREDEVISFGADISPLYVDPDEILLIFPDSSRLEIAEVIHAYSHEVNSLFSITADTVNPMEIMASYGIPPFSVYQYIRASTACELTRIYGYGGDDELSVELADLKITNRNTPRSNITRSNATTWCQIAAALRKEIVNKRVGIKGVQPKGLPRFKGYSPSGSLDPETGALIFINDTNTYGSRDMSRPGLPSIQGDDPIPDRGIKRYD
jgi:hypothetical protein